MVSIVIPPILPSVFAAALAAAAAAAAVVFVFATSSFVASEGGLLPLILPYPIVTPLASESDRAVIFPSIERVEPLKLSLFFKLKLPLLSR